MTPEETIRESWQREGSAAPLPSIAELRDRADAFRRKIKRRNLIEYIAGGLSMIVFAFVAVVVPAPGMRIALMALMIGLIIVMWQLHKRTAPLTPPEHGGQYSVLEYQSRELTRQRDALNTVFLWYLLPIIPGMVLFYSLPLFDPDFAGQSEVIWRVLRKIGFASLFFGVVYWLNKRAAGKLQRKLDDIEALRSA